GASDAVTWLDTLDDTAIQGRPLKTTTSGYRPSYDSAARHRYGSVQPADPGSACVITRPVQATVPILHAARSIRARPCFSRTRRVAQRIRVGTSDRRLR